MGRESRIVIPGQNDRNQRLVLEQMMQAAVHDALEEGNAVPFHLVGQDVVLGPPSPQVTSTGDVVPVQRFALLRPFFDGEGSDTGIYLPAFALFRESGIILPANQVLLQPFVARTRKLEVHGVTMNAVVRGPLSISFLGPERILEMRTVPALAWTCMLPEDLVEFGKWLEQRVTGEEAMILGTDDGQLPDGQTLYSLQDQYVRELRTTPCIIEGCEKGTITKEGQKRDCLECLFRGRVYSKGESSSDQDAGTEPGEPSEPDSPAVTSND